MFVYSQILMLKPLTPDVIIFWGGVIERWLGPDDIMRVGPHDGISDLMRRGRERILSPSMNTL